MKTFTVLGTLVAYLLGGWDAALPVFVVCLIVAAVRMATLGMKARRAGKHKIAGMRLPGMAFAHVNDDGEQRAINVDEYRAMIDDLQAPVEEAFDLIDQFRIKGDALDPDKIGELMRYLSDEIREQCDRLEGFEIDFSGGADDLHAYRSAIVEGRHISTLLAAAAERGISPATLSQKRKPLSGRYKLIYVNADGERSEHRVDAVAYSVIGDRAYLWAIAYADILQFRVDRIEALSEIRKKTVIDRNAIPDWLARRAGAI